MTTRREFLKTCGIGAAAALVPLGLPETQLSHPERFTSAWFQALGLGNLPYSSLRSSDWWLWRLEQPQFDRVIWKPVKISCRLPRLDGLEWDECSDFCHKFLQRELDLLGWLIERRVHYRRQNMPRRLFQHLTWPTVVHEQNRFDLYCHLSPGPINEAELAEVREVVADQHEQLQTEYRVSDFRYPPAKRSWSNLNKTA
jgi:hypothetical protein